MNSATEEALRVGVCILRVESHPDYLVLTVTTNRNLNRSLYSAQPAPARQVSDIEEAIALVRDFIGSVG